MRRMVKISVVAALLIVFTAASTSAAGAQAGEIPGPTGDAPSYRDYDPSIFVDSDGNAHVVWQRDGSGRGIYYSTNRSGEWVAQRVTRGAYDSMPELGLDRRGRVRIAFVRSETPDAGIFVAKKTAGEWALKRLVRDGLIEYGIGFAVAPNGTLHVAWNGTSDGRGFYYATNASGAVVKKKLGTGFTDGAVSLTRSSAGKVYIAFKKTGTDSADGIYRYTNANGSLASSGRKVVNGDYAQWPTITIDGNGRVRIVYFSSRSADPSSFGVRLRRLTAQGGLVFDAELSAFDTPERAAPAGAVQPNGRIHAAWEDRRFPNQILVTETDGDDTSDLVTDYATTTETDSDKRSIALALGPDGNDHIAFTDSYSTPPEILYVTGHVGQPGTSEWSEPVSVARFP